MPDSPVESRTGDANRRHVAGDLRFEIHLLDISANLLRSSPFDVDTEIDDALSRINAFFNSNMCGLFRVRPELNEAFLTHFALSVDVTVTPEKTNYAESCPWAYSKVVRGEVILLDDLDDYPDEAESDRRLNESLGIQAALMIPVSIGGATKYMLEIASTRKGPIGLRDHIPRLQVFAEVLASALERNKAVIAHLETETRLDLAAGLAGAGLWDINLETGTIWATPRARELYGVAPEKPINLDWLYTVVHPEDVENLKYRLARAIETKETLDIEYRVIVPGGGIRWMTVRGRRSPKSFAGGNHFLGVSIDTSDRKRLEEAARRSHEEIKRLNELLEVETRYLRKEVGMSHSYKEIVGKSEAIRKVMQHVEQVAPADSMVLVTGETGTGKDLVAQAIHSFSKRKERLMVKVDCASLPGELIENELFGRERGAYTGAMTRQIGRFQLADKGTIFLDEIGELPRETQAKLLRVVQEGCFEPLGSPKTVHVDVRIIAATNRDLAREVREGRFREDLYYRLNVFPIVVPPLRDRKEDIPMLVWAFVEKFCIEMRKDIRRVPAETMDALVRYSWPGNIRELRNLIEQAFIVSPGDVLLVRLPNSRETKGAASQTMEEMERRHILSVLEETNWRIKGPRGAASLLGINPSNLYFRMKKLGIPTRREKDKILT